MELSQRNIQAIKLGWTPIESGIFPKDKYGGERYLVMRKGLVELCTYENDKWYFVNSDCCEASRVQFWKKIKCPNW